MEKFLCQHVCTRTCMLIAVFYRGNDFVYPFCLLKIVFSNLKTRVSITFEILGTLFIIIKTTLQSKENTITLL